MKPLELARRYMECVFKTSDFNQLYQILDANLQFRGPLYNFDSAEEYINSLLADPPVNFDYEIIRTYLDGSSICLVYKFSKPGVKTTMVQTFDTEGEKIVSILLVFDTSVFQKD